MRITNSMTSNNTLININRNMRYLNKVTQQIESLKKISTPSDDPIIASRALKFRTSVAETQQFSRNVQSGLAWMEVAEAALIDTNENLMKQFESLFTEGATGSETYDDKMAIIASLKELVNQMEMDMNQSYAGRYVFSGYRTDQPPVLIEDNANMSYRIDQVFQFDDVEKIMSYEKYDDDETAHVVPSPENSPPGNDGAYVLKLAYRPDGLTAETIPKIVRADGTASTITNVLVKKLNNDTVPPLLDAYEPPARGTAHYIPETGEIVLHPDDAKDSLIFDNSTPGAPDGLKITYDKTGFEKGELNPIVYFDCTDLLKNPTPGTGTNPAHPQYTMDNQEIQYEFSTNTYITINSLAKDIYTDKMYVDFKRLIEFAESLEVSKPGPLQDRFKQDALPDTLSPEELDKKVTEQISNETALLNSVLHDRFNNMLGLLDKHSGTAMEQHTTMGSRMLRLELLSSRLEDDEIAYTKLMSENEDTVLPYAIMQKANAEAALQASLQANSKIMQLSLANFI